MSDDYLKAAFTGEFDTVAPLHQVSKSVSHVWWHGGMIKDVERDDPILIDDLDVCFQAANDLIRFQQEPAVAPLLADLVMSLGLSMTRGPSSLALEPGTKEYEKTPTWVVTDRKPTNYDKIMAFFNRDESEFPFFAAWKAYNTAATPEAALQIAKDRELVHNPAEAKAFIDTCNAVDKTGALKYAYIGFVMLNVCRLITKDVNNMGNMAVRVAKSFSSIYRTSAPTPNNWFAAPALLAIKNGLNPGRPVVKGFITMVASQWETGLTSSDPVMTEFKSVLEAGVVIALVMNSMPLIAITDRVLEVLKISFIALLKSIYFEDIKQSVAMIQGVQTLYMFDPATRALLLAKNPSLTPITDARLWRFSRLLNPNVMSGLSGNNHDTFLYLMIEIHDNFSPNPMKASYRKFMPTVSEAHLNKLASAAKEGIGAIHVGAPEFTGTAVKALPADMRVPVAKKKEKEKAAAAPVAGSAPKAVGTPAPKPTTTTGAVATTTPAVEETPAPVDPALNKKPRTEDTEESDSGEEVEDL